MFLENFELIAAKVGLSQEKLFVWEKAYVYNKDGLVETNIY